MDVFDKWHHDQVQGGRVEGWPAHAFCVRHLQGVARDAEFCSLLEERIEKNLLTEFEPNMTKWEVVASQIDMFQSLTCLQVGLGSRVV